MFSHSPQWHIAPLPTGLCQRACILETSQSILFRVFLLQIGLFQILLWKAIDISLKKKNTKSLSGGDRSSWYSRVSLHYLAFGHIWARVSWSFTAGTTEMVRQGRGGNCGGLTCALDALLVSELNPVLGSQVFPSQPCRSHCSIASYFGQPFRTHAAKSGAPSLSITYLLVSMQLRDIYSSEGLSRNCNLP